MSGTCSTRARASRPRTSSPLGTRSGLRWTREPPCCVPASPGHEVDAAARASLVAAGYEEPKYALGHQLGRAAHDGGTLLAPLWDRYGDAPRGLVEEGHVYTLEYGAPVPGRGYIGLEEDVLVTADGIEWLSTPQRELWLVG